MRRAIVFGLFGVVFVSLLVLFYFYFPEIWGASIYPLKYENEIISASEEFDLPRNFIAGVIYTESGFNPKAKSRVGASGLMQLMPATARSIAKKIPIKNYTNLKIFNPAINIRLGAYYLRSQIDKYSGDLDAVLAHYNGGPKVAGNLLSRGSKFIPLETKRFITKVKKAQQAYDRIYGQNWEGPSKPFRLARDSSFVDFIRLDKLINLFK